MTSLCDPATYGVSIRILVDFAKLRGSDHDVAEYIRTVKYEFAKRFQDTLYKFYRENPDAVVGGIEIPEPKAAN